MAQLIETQKAWGPLPWGAFVIDLEVKNNGIIMWAKRAKHETENDAPFNNCFILIPSAIPKSVVNHTESSPESPSLHF